MKWFMHLLLAMIANASEAELAKYIEFLKVENQILRDRLPDKIHTTEAERDKLLKVGKQLGSKINKLISIVTPRTFQRWVEADSTKRFQEPEVMKPARGGNRKSQEIHDLVLAIRKETGWGAGRIKGELYLLSYRSICRATINNILRKHGFKPEPPGNPDNTWNNFLRRHASTLWACDFFTKPVLTMSGWVDWLDRPGRIGCGNRGGYAALSGRLLR